MVCAVYSKALKNKNKKTFTNRQFSTARESGNEKKKSFCTPFEFAYALPDDRIATPRRRDALQSIDDELTSFDEPRATCPARLHFGMSLMHELHRSKGRAQGYATHNERPRRVSENGTGTSVWGKPHELCCPLQR